MFKSKKNLSDYGEFGLIDLIKKYVTLSPSIIQGIGDDTAVLPLNKSKYLLFTTDMLIEGVHFTHQCPTSGVGHKALACSISDIAAMGGIPTSAVISLGVPKDLSLSYVRQLYRGVQKIARPFDVSIVGGDTVKSDKIIINVALMGEVAKKDVVYRSGAKVGDHIFVTGPLGRSLITGQHLKFIPRVKESQFLVKHLKPTSMIDISDGLVSDLGHILKASDVGAVIDKVSVPRRKKASLQEALCDGEDFELLFTLSSKNSKRCEFYKIGEVVKGKGSNLLSKGYQHF
ncbi:Thiamine-monophosphate kinase [hydrothermal vent metagenome]|uniref:Thiamine-monophosphate kinase n=1 Tax=hydrothermal vent metagenome TaxID=652676 RepID=A0A3B1D9U1_9ZZZZ